MKLHSICNWDVRCIGNKLVNDSNIKDIPFIKLRGPDRVYIKDMQSYFDN